MEGGWGQQGYGYDEWGNPLPPPGGVGGGFPPTQGGWEGQQGGWGQPPIAPGGPVGGWGGGGSHQQHAGWGGQKRTVTGNWGQPEQGWGPSHDQSWGQPQPGWVEPNQWNQPPQQFGGQPGGFGGGFEDQAMLTDWFQQR